MALVLLNLRAGGGHAAKLEGPLREALKRHHPGVPLHVTRGALEATRLLASAARGSRVVLVGGDGCLHQLLPAVLAGAHELALVPAGHNNHSAGALHLHHLPWPRALARALTAEACAVDIGWVRTEHEERPFFSSLAGGFDAAVAERLNATVGTPFAGIRGWPRFALAVIAELPALRRQALHIEIDGTAWFEGDALFTSILNAPTQGAALQALTPPRIDDGQLNLLVAGSLSRSATLLMLMRRLLGKPLSQRDVRCASASKLQIDSATPLPLAADGETMKSASHITVRVGRQVLQVVAGATFNPRTIARTYKP